MDFDGLLKSAEHSVVSALFGFLAAVAAFRSKFALIEVNHTSLRAEIATARASDKTLMDMQFQALRIDVERNAKKIEEYHVRMERRQIASLEMLSGLAMKQGLKHRALGTDALSDIIERGENE